MRFGLIVVCQLVACATLLAAQPANAEPESLLPPNFYETPATESADVVPENAETSSDPAPTNASPWPQIIPLFGQGTADPGDVRSLVGDIRFQMTDCREPEPNAMESNRSVRGDLSRVPDDWENRPALVDAVLANAAQFVWQACPQHLTFLERPLDEFRYNVQHVEIYGPAGAMIFSARLGDYGLHGDQSEFSSRRGYVWQNFRNVAAEDRVAAQNAEQARIAGEQRAQAQAQAREETGKAIANFVFWIKLLVIAIGAIWLFTKREAIARFFYGLRPHPARQLVDAAISHGERIDGALFDQLVGIQFSSPIESDVRAGQAQELVARLREHERVLRAHETRLMEAERLRIGRENAALRQQNQLRQAAVDHQTAAARLDEFGNSTRPA